MIRSLIVVSLALLGGLAAQEPGPIHHVKSRQVPGTHTIEITYDVAQVSTAAKSQQRFELGKVSRHPEC